MSIHALSGGFRGHTNSTCVNRITSIQLFPCRQFQYPPDTFLVEVSRIVLPMRGNTYCWCIFVIRWVDAEQLDHDVFSTRDICCNTIRESSTAINGNFNSCLHQRGRRGGGRRHVGMRDPLSLLTVLSFFELKKSTAG